VLLEAGPALIATFSPDGALSPRSLLDPLGEARHELPLHGIKVIGGVDGLVGEEAPPQVEGGEGLIPWRFVARTLDGCVGVVGEALSVAGGGAIDEPGASGLEPRVARVVQL